MSYKQKIEASYERAHNAQIATKILQELGDLRNSVASEPRVARRWIWELIQNAKDVGIENVKIRIEYSPNQTDPSLIFRHNGGPFTAEDIRFLIEQVSSKNRAKDETGRRKKSGKFGTGFLTTHLLNEKVMVSGVAKEPELDYVSFSVELDRTGYEDFEILDAVEEAKQQLDDIDNYPTLENYIEGAFNTGFSYSVYDKISTKVATDGLNSLAACLSYVFAFVPELEEVYLTHGDEKYTNNIERKNISPGIDYIEVIIPDLFGLPETFGMLKLTKNYTSIIVPVNNVNERFSLKEIGTQVPKLFCDFPLIGSEEFHFPVIINNPNFNPTDTRDGIFMAIPPGRTNPKTEENRTFLLEAVDLYSQLLDYASAEEFENLHLLAQIEPLKQTEKWMDSAWFESHILNPVRDLLLYVNIVRTADGKLKSILSPEDNSAVMWFPSASSKELRSDIWKLSSDWIPGRIPHEDDVELWNKLAWGKFTRLTTENIAATLHQKSIIAFRENVIRTDFLEWLQEFYTLLDKEGAKYDQIINKYAIFPDQNGNFQMFAKLNRDSGDIGDDFKKILSLLGADICPILVADGIEINIPEERIKDQAFAVRRITEEVTDKSNNREEAKNYKEAFKKLLYWFKKNESKASDLFPGIYSRKYLLYDEEEVMETIERSEEIKELMEEFKINSLQEMREMLNKSMQHEQDEKEDFEEVTERLIMSLGISSEAEWIEVLKDPKLAEKFRHASLPTPEMYDYAQLHIDRAKKSILDHLKNDPDYDLENADFTAKTVLSGVVKNNKEISIVMRPAFDGYVIIYYGAELDTLDFSEAELWADSEVGPMRVSLGHILKKARIKKFPI